MIRILNTTIGAVFLAISLFAAGKAHSEDTNEVRARRFRWVVTSPYRMRDEDKPVQVELLVHEGKKLEQLPKAFRDMGAARPKSPPRKVIYAMVEGTPVKDQQRLLMEALASLREVWPEAKPIFEVRFFKPQTPGEFYEEMIAEVDAVVKDLASGYRWDSADDPQLKFLEDALRGVGKEALNEALLDRGFKAYWTDPKAFIDYWNHPDRRFRWNASFGIMRMSTNFMVRLRQVSQSERPLHERTLAAVVLMTVPPLYDFLQVTFQDKFNKLFRLEYLQKTSKYRLLDVLLRRYHKSGKAKFFVSSLFNLGINGMVMGVGAQFLGYLNNPSFNPHDPLSGKDVDQHDVNKVMLNTGMASVFYSFWLDARHRLREKDVWDISDQHIEILQKAASSLIGIANIINSIAGLRNCLGYHPFGFTDVTILYPQIPAWTFYAAASIVARAAPTRTDRWVIYDERIEREKYIDVLANTGTSSHPDHFYPPVIDLENEREAEQLLSLFGSLVRREAIPVRTRWFWRSAKEADHPFMNSTNHPHPAQENEGPCAGIARLRSNYFRPRNLD